MPLKKIEGESSISIVARRASNCSETFFTKRGHFSAPGMMSLSCESIWQPLHTPSENVSGRSKNALNIALRRSLKRIERAQPEPAPRTSP